MYKNIIPSLVSFETNIKKLSGFYLSDKFSFYPEISQKNLFHYRALIDNQIKIPSRYDFRNGYFIKKGNCWYYQRKIKGFELNFCLDFKKRIFRFNRLYSFVPFEVGHVFPVGRHLADLINLELFLADYHVFRGCAFIHKEKYVCIIAPGLNGKTTFITKMIRKGCHYLAEDMLIINFKKMLLYSCSPRSDFFAREPSSELGKLISKENYQSMVQKGVKLDKIYLVQNVTSQKFIPRHKTLFDYINLNSFAYNSNPFLKSFIFEENYSEEVFDKLYKLRKARINCDFRQVNNFDYEKAFEEIFNE